MHLFTALRRRAAVQIVWLVIFHIWNPLWWWFFFFPQWESKPSGKCSLKCSMELSSVLLYSKTARSLQFPVLSWISDPGFHRLSSCCLWEAADYFSTKGLRSTATVINHAPSTYLWSDGMKVALFYSHLKKKKKLVFITPVKSWGKHLITPSKGTVLVHMGYK